ncbi:MAG: 30S ribosomal protein S3 [Parcubacteria group bacterium]|nr:30S ribosomal protein S3 [Parcubacteria group bacterium]
MGQKIHPRNYRLGVIEGWRSKWFSRRDAYRTVLREDVMVRSFIQKKLAEARVEKIEIERGGRTGDITVNIHTAKPGMVIGRGGAGIEELKVALEKNVLKNAKKAHINIHEVRQGALSAAVVAQNVASDLMRRIPFRRAVKQAIDQVQKAGAKGVKIRVSGRLNGAEIARVETLSSGSVPLHTLRANIDYDDATAFTTYGAVGVSVWIYKGDVFEEGGTSAEKPSDVLAQIKKITAEKESAEAD